MAQAKEHDRYQESREIWKDYNDRQEFEHDLIDRKTTWWLSAQALLFTAYGGALAIQFRNVSDSAKPELRNIADFRGVIACVGLAVAIVTLVGVSAVIYSKYRSWRDYQKFYAGSPKSLPQPHKAPLQWGVRTPNTLLSLSPDFLLPVIFIVGWITVLRRWGLPFVGS